MLQLLLHPLLLESPKWLSLQGQAHEAQAVLNAISAKPAPEHDVPSSPRSCAVDSPVAPPSAVGTPPGVTLDDPERQPLEEAAAALPGGVCALLREPRYRVSLRLVCVVMLAQQCSGINNAFNYSSTFLAAHGATQAQVDQVALLMNAGNVLVTCVAAFLLDRAGRKPLLLFSTLAMAVSAAGLTYALNLGADSERAATLTKARDPWSVACHRGL